MKKQIANNMSKSVNKTFILFALATMLLINCIPVPAHADLTKPITPDIAITYAGSINGEPVFKIQFENKSGETLDLTLSDEDGVVLYNQQVKEKIFLKRFRFDKTVPQNIKLILTLASSKEKQKQTFRVNTTMRTVQDVVITKL